MDIDFQDILESSENSRDAISSFLRDIIAIPGESGQEEAVINRVKEEMETLGFDRVEVDPMGNLLGFIGNGSHLIAIDGHIDTVGVGNRELWEVDPYKGSENEDIIIGRGASDQLGGVASMVYAGKLIKDLDLEGDYTLMMTATIQEEDCDGLCWTFIVEEDQYVPEFVVLTEPTSCRIYRGHRGRMEIKVSTSGISAHGSAPERGDNAIYKMGPILAELEALNNSLMSHDFLGKGSLTVSEIFHGSPSRCAVADQCWISIDRRLTFGESVESALEEIRSLPSVKKYVATVETYPYEKLSYRGLPVKQDAYFPTWLITEDHPVTKTVTRAYTELFHQTPQVDKWTFSTNGVSIMGRHGIPCIGFGPGHEDQAHAPNECTWKNELVEAAAMYAVIPLIYVNEFSGKMPKTTKNPVD